MSDTETATATEAEVRAALRRALTILEEQEAEAIDRQLVIARFRRTHAKAIASVMLHE